MSINKVYIFSLLVNNENSDVEIVDEIFPLASPNDVMSLKFPAGSGWQVWKGGSNTEQYLMEITKTNHSFQVKKSMYFDFVKKQATGIVCGVKTYPMDFTSQDSIQSIFDNFNASYRCTGLKDDRFDALISNCKLGVCQDNVWRSHR